MAKNSNSDNPWAEMSRLNSATKSGVSQSTDEQDSSDDSAEYTLDELQEMSLKDLQAIAKEAGVDFKGLSKDDLIDALAEETNVVADDSDDADLELDEIDGELTLEQALALLGDDSDTEDDFSDQELEVVEEEVLDGEVEEKL